MAHRKHIFEPFEHKIAVHVILILELPVFGPRYYKGNGVTNSN